MLFQHAYYFQLLYETRDQYESVSLKYTNKIIVYKWGCLDDYCQQLTLKLRTSSSRLRHVGLLHSMVRRHSS